MIKEFTVHEFTMGDVEDPEVYAAEPLHAWQTSDQGKWVIENAVEQPYWTQSVDPSYYGYRFHVRAKFEDEKITEWLLRSKT